MSQLLFFILGFIIGGLGMTTLMCCLQINRINELERQIVLKDEIEEVLCTLTPREEEVLKLRFGLHGGTCHTLEEVGNMFGVTRERIRQIEAKALRKLRHPSRSRKLKDFLND